MPSTGSPALFGRALWVWEVETYAMLENASAADEAVAILRRHGIDTVYLYADAFGDRNLIVERPARYEDVVTRLHASGLRVYAMLGSAYLNTEHFILPAHRGQAEAMLRRVLDTHNLESVEGRVAALREAAPAARGRFFLREMM